MNEQDNTQQDNTKERLKFVQQLNEVGMIIEGVEVKNNKDGFEKLTLTPEQKIQMSGLLQHMPALTTAGKMAGAYTVKFPKGLPHTLMALGQGGYGSPIISKEGIIGMASFTPMLGQAVVMGVFTVLSIATSQYFLAQINKELLTINKKLDEILSFLYGDKKAELVSELRFVQYARDNYASIMRCENQRVATLGSIQNAKKVAMKDIEFYAEDLQKKVNDNKNADANTLLRISKDQIAPIGECFDLSLQLYLMSNLMEVYYAQNFTEDYVNYLKNDKDEYLNHFRDNIAESYRALEAYIDKGKIPAKLQKDLENCKEGLAKWKKKFKEAYDDRLKKLDGILTKTTHSTEYYLEVEGAEYNLYYKDA